MYVYVLIFLISTVLYYAYGTVNNQQGAKNQKNVLIVTMTFLALFVGFADMLGGYDRYIYGEEFDQIADLISIKNYNFQDTSLFRLYPKEFGYQIYNILMAFITENRYIFILTTTIIIYVLLFRSIKRYCSNYPFAIILFLGLWFFFSFTYLRQVMGATISWLSIRYIAKRDLKKFLLIWVIAWSFHNSAFILLPMYWVPVRKFNPQKVKWVMFFALVLGLTGGPTALFNAYGEVDQVRAQIGGNETGFRIAYLIEAGFFLYLILSRYKEIPNKPLNIVLLNMSLVFCAILLFFIKNENGGRLSWYYMIGIISTISYLCTHTHRNKKLANTIVVVCFFLFIRILNTWGIMLYPYKTMFTNGIRKGDAIEMEYEYDSGYNFNKFYRPIFRFMKK